MSKLGLIGRALAYLKAVRWRRPGESRDSESCVLMDLDVDVPPDATRFLGITLAILQRLDGSVDAGHPIFRWMGDQQQAGKASELTVSNPSGGEGDPPESGASIRASERTGIGGNRGSTPHIGVVGGTLRYDAIAMDST